VKQNGKEEGSKEKESYQKSCKEKEKEII